MKRQFLKNVLLLVLISLTFTNAQESTDLVIEDLKETITTASQIYSMAFSQLNGSLLSKVYMGEELEYWLDNLEEVRESGTYWDEKLLDVVFYDFEIDGDKAEVYMNELWEGTTYEIASNECVAYYPPYEAPQTIFLQKENDTWMIYHTESHDTEEIKEEPCPID